jgi:hypothetical protein
MKNLLKTCSAVALITLASVPVTLSNDFDTDKDGRRDWNKGGADRDLDNDGRRDWGNGGPDKDIGNDGRRDKGTYPH